jgi:hypothetical protein
VQEAFKLGRIYIVNENWFNHSVALWRRQKETNFPVPLDDPQPPVPGSTPTTANPRSGQVIPKVKKKPIDTTLDTSNPSTNTIDKPGASTSRTTDKAENTTADVAGDTLETTTEGDQAGVLTESTLNPPPDVPPVSNPETITNRTASTTAAGTAAMNGKTLDVETEKIELEMTESIGNEVLETINWSSVNDEVEEMMGESDDEDDTKSQRSGMGSDDGWTSENR